MKRITLIFAMAASVMAAKAQAPAHWDENTGRTMNADISRTNDFSGVEMEANGKVITFSHVPESSQEIKVVVTDAQGTEVFSKAITPLHNVLQINSLRKGRVYFVTLQWNNKTQKAFTLRE